MKEVYDHYVSFGPVLTEIRTMSFKTFHECVKATQREFRLKATKTDACDVCEWISVGLMEEGLSDDERLRLEEELADHQQRTTSPSTHCRRSSDSRNEGSSDVSSSHV